MIVRVNIPVENLTKEIKLKIEKLVAKHKGKVCGEKEMQVPESIYEAVELVGEERALELFLDGYKISERSSLYPTPEGKPSRVALAKKEIYETLIGSGISVEVASKATGYIPGA